MRGRASMRTKSKDGDKDRSRMEAESLGKDSNAGLRGWI